MDDYNEIVKELLRMRNFLDNAVGEWAAEQKRVRKADRKYLGYAKRLARALRHDLVLAAGYHIPVSKEWADDLIERYYKFCDRIRIAPPAVKVPRALRMQYGRVLGGEPAIPWASVCGDVDYVARLMNIEPEKPYNIRV